ncbi:hypothetical protein BH10CYA1_BH10CYA1_59100 [soil metagenome]
MYCRIKKKISCSECLTNTGFIDISFLRIWFIATIATENPSVAKTDRHYLGDEYANSTQSIFSADRFIAHIATENLCPAMGDRYYLATKNEVRKRLHFLMLLDEAL